jgi:hypothetical protein
MRPELERKVAHRVPPTTRDVSPFHRASLGGTAFATNRAQPGVGFRPGQAGKAHHLTKAGVLWNPSIRPATHPGERHGDLPIDRASVVHDVMSKADDGAPRTRALSGMLRPGCDTLAAGRKPPCRGFGRPVYWP